MKYQNAVDYLNKVPSFGKKSSLEHVQCILDVLGNPERDLKFVHVAGTNGKGSTCAMIESILHSCGVKTGLFLSPHVMKINERIQIETNDITDELFETCFEKVKAGVDTVVSNGGNHPSFFEFLFFMALLAFKKMNLEICVIETGMGGRRDATNVLTPLVSVITSISIDHTEFLGSTLAEIAREKAGIIKPKVPVVYSYQNDTISREIDFEISKKNAVKKCFSKENLKIIDFLEDYEYDKDEMVPIGLFGDFQRENALLAIQAVLQVYPRCSSAHILQGLKDVRLSGRMERINEWLYVDGAHNMSGIDTFCDMICRYFPGKKALFYAPSHKKEREPILKKLRQIENLVELVEIPVEHRALDKDVLNIACQKMNMWMHNKVTCFCVGSFYLAGEIKKYMEDRTHD
ncbi:MAG: Mur ligase family protein [Anaerostipes sp.]|jgi:dihydrofolate synthase/folylpolyglutamate synthase|nr:Mur ligase family protein [Anaerostipes sp.]